MNWFSVSDIENSVLDFEFDIRLNDIEEFRVSERFLLAELGED